MFRCQRLIPRAVLAATAVSTLVAGVTGVGGVAHAAATTVRITGVAGQQTTLVLLPTRGAALNVTPAGNGNFSINVPSSTLQGASLQVVKSGRYVGPVTLAYARNRGYLRFGRVANGATLNLGALDVLLQQGWAKFHVPVNPQFVDATHPVVVDANGKPRGAGKLGLVTKQTVAGKLGAAASDPCTPGAPETGPGGDCDGDGIPNAADVDDNGNMTLDMTDPASAQTTAQVSPWAQLYLGMTNTLNANAGALTPDKIATTLGGVNTFGVNFFIDDHYFNGATPDNVSVNCGAIVWCNSSTGTAYVSGMNETPGFSSTPWKDYQGATWTNGVETPLAHPAQHNGLYHMTRPGTPPLSVWVAGVQPRDGANTLNDLVPGQMLGLDLTKNGVTTEMMMTLNPYPVTVPALKDFSTTGSEASNVDYTSEAPAGSWFNPIAVGSDGLVHFDFWRPQRLALQGESGQFRDLGHLHYGMVLSGGGQEIGCSSDANSGYYPSVGSSFNRTPDTGPWAMNLWPLTDKAGDATVDASSTLSFTIDIRRCLTDHNVVIPPDGLDVWTSLTAAGEFLSGGANRAVQQVKLHVPAAS